MSIKYPVDPRACLSSSPYAVGGRGAPAPQGGFRKAASSQDAPSGSPPLLWWRRKGCLFLSHGVGEVARQGRRGQIACSGSAPSAASPGGSSTSPRPSAEGTRDVGTPIRVFSKYQVPSMEYGILTTRSHLLSLLSEVLPLRCDVVPVHPCNHIDRDALRACRLAFAIVPA